MKTKYWGLLCALFVILISSVTYVRTAAQTSGEPELPRVLLDTTYIPPTGNTINVPAGGNLQAALDSANPGDVIMLAAGASFVGNFTLPNKSGSSWIIVRSSAPDASLPPEGTRILPSYSSLMPKIISPNAAPALATAAAAHHFRFIGVEFGLAAGLSLNYGIITFGSSSQNSLDQVPHDLILDRCYIHGNATGDVARGVALNCASGAVIDSYLSNLHGVGFDTQAIAAWNGPGPLKIVNNYLEGAGENVLFGGSDPAISGLVVSDIEFRRNQANKPLSWNPRDSSYAGIHWAVKNLFELKNAQRVLVDGNVFEYNWVDAQNGTAILFTPRNQDGTAPWCVVQDVTFTNNIVRHTAAGMDLLGHDDIHPALPLQRVKIKNNLFDDVGNALWGNNNVLFYLLDGTTNVTFDHNTGFNTGNVVSIDGRQHSGFIYTNNLTAHNDYGVIGSGYGTGLPSLTAYFTSYVFAKNLLAGGPASSYPAGNFFPATLDNVGFVDRAGGNYRLAASSPYKNAGTDGRDIGADIDAIQVAIAGSGLPPNPPLSVTIGVAPASGCAPLPVSFTCTASSPNGAIVSYRWDFGDGQSTSSQFPTHTYSATGSYMASLLVTDSTGATGAAYTTVTATTPLVPPSPSDVVLYAATAGVRVGNYQVVSDSSAAGGSRIWNPDAGAAKLIDPLANPSSYFELTFNAQAGTAYRLWLRGKAEQDSPYNDSVFVQFSDSVDSSSTAQFRIGTTSSTVMNLEDCSGCGLSGWGWQDNGWGVGVMGPLIYFQTSGTHTLRIQPREDGLSIDQVVLSAQSYLTQAPGSLANDTTILPPFGGTSPPAPAPTITSLTTTSGTTAGGTSVTLTGTNFVSGATVSFGGSSALNVNVTSSTTITANTPAHAAGAVNVTVSNPDGQSATLNNGFTYTTTAPPPPTISGITPNNGTTAGGTAVTLSGSNFVSGATVSFGGTAASNVTVTSSTTIMATTPAQPAGAVNVTVTNPDGQSATLNNSFTYTSLPAPTINKISPASGRITGGTSVMIKGSGFVKGATVLFGDVKAMTVTVSGSNAISAVSPPHASGAVNIVVINPDGQSSTLVRGFTYTVGKTAN